MRSRYPQIKAIKSIKKTICIMEWNNGLWGIYVPCYELPVIEELTGLKADNF